LHTCAPRVKLTGLFASGRPISSKTVAIHIEHVLTKLDVHSRAQAVAAAYRERLVAAPSAPVNRVQGGSR
jgi:hypothetical protein